MDSYLPDYQYIVLVVGRQPQFAAYVCKNIRFDDNSCAFDGICAFANANQNFFKMALKINRKPMWITFFIIVLVLLALSFSKFEIRKEVEINATPEKVWATIIDFPNYKHWNTQLSYLGGDVKPNGSLHLRLSVEGTNPYDFKPKISHWDENKIFAWIAITGLPRIFDGEHFFELIELGNNKTLVINREEYRGILSLIMKNLPMMKDAPTGFEKMNLELKNYIEKL